MKRALCLLVLGLFSAAVVGCHAEAGIDRSVTAVAIAAAAAIRVGAVTAVMAARVQRDGR